MKFNQLIAQRTKKLLKERQWTDYKLAMQSGIPPSTLSCILHCKYISLNTETLLNICRGFNIGIFDFFNDSSFIPENISDD